MSLQKIFSSINFQGLKDISATSIKDAFSSVDENAKNEIIEWLNSIQEIKNNKNFSKKRMETEISKVRTTETIFNFLNSLIDVLVNKIPIKNKGIIKAGLAAAGIAVTVLNIRVSTVTALVGSKALPKFIMSSKFDELSEFIISSLDASEDLN
ncbi:MAG: hypothetical protein AABY64_05115 [Bdellovibrionota bacterium]